FEKNSGYNATRAPGGFTFVAPAFWSERLSTAGPGVIRRFERDRGSRVISDASGLLVLALWKGEAPSEARRLAGVEASGARNAALNKTASLKRKPPVKELPHELLIGSWLTTMRRYVRMHARLGLSEIVRREGRVAWSRTHIDILMDHAVSNP